MPIATTRPYWTSLAFSLVMIVGGSAQAQPTLNKNPDATAKSSTTDLRTLKILFDEAHFNVHTTFGSYKPLVESIESHGARVTPLRGKINPEVLEPYDILLIANALGAEGPDDPQAEQPAFATFEVEAIRNWVDAGGALLLIADHAPAGAAVADLASKFGVHMSNRRTTDPTNAGEQYPSGAQDLIFSRDNGLLGDHPITKGRGPTERIHAFITFTGQSLLGPVGSSVLLRLGANARDADPFIKEGVSAAGRAQGLALQVGRGRVVVLSEAGCLTANYSPRRGPIGLDHPDGDNRQMALNIVRWLAGAAFAEENGDVELKLVVESRWEALLGESMDRYEASGIAYTGEQLITVFDNDARLAMVSLGLEAENAKLYGEPEDGQSNFEGIAYDADTGHFYVIVEAEKRGKKEWRGRVLHYDADLRLVEDDNLETELPSGDKGFEGLAFVRRNGTAYLLALFEGNHADEGKKGKEKGHGRVEVFQRDAKGWRSVLRMALPETAAFVDYSGIDLRDERLAVVSQSSARLFVARLPKEGWQVETPGKVYAFPRGPDGKELYCKIEGVAWIDDRRLAFVSDKSKHCAERDQSIHVFELPD